MLDILAERIVSSGVTQLAGGRAHNCALRNTQKFFCWGFNGSSQIGDGATVTRLQPVLASNVSGTIRSLALGGDSSCAVLAGGEGICWGNNDYGRLGNGSMTASLAVPQPITQWLLDDLIFRDDFED
ncbi:Regulator of Chromosome Condensation (RCC1) repeat protein [Tahibacter aquaticus]|uniref:Regulator of Chromosome Condensation (RCC1) repeat protein n=1 Tax=Tahibacter aquaticus TaxID=520092 RepID=A0A4R6Z546_9GAMM|nr:hypothetical protein [Tahibacter aquaticus]TDR46791.1 Regulator of Chromosome Condensation (RCC1) repeat protein [Tahibacter aquaticus]